MKCGKCELDVPAHVDRCVGCQADVGFPNVRSAQRDAETAALQQRYERARTDAEARGCLPQVELLERRLDGSHAVLCRRWGVAARLLSSDQELYPSYHAQIKEQSRLPEDNKYDAERQSVDAKLFPNYYEKMRFAALSVDGSGAAGYGGCAMVLKTGNIADRATVFEENTFYFFKKQQLRYTEPTPAGFMADWPGRSHLGVAKLAGRVLPSHDETDLDRLILSSNGNAGEEDFIEVHVYGPLHRRAVAYAHGALPEDPLDQALVLALKERLDLARIPLDLT